MYKSSAREVRAAMADPKIFVAARHALAHKVRLARGPLRVRAILAARKQRTSRSRLQKNTSTPQNTLNAPQIP